jgi:hypothetical protein
MKILNKNTGPDFKQKFFNMDFFPTSFLGSGSVFVHTLKEVNVIFNPVIPFL